MRISIQAKLLVMCILLVLLTTVAISTTYYVLTKQNTHRESQERIKIAFGIILDDLNERFKTSTQRFSEFLQNENTLSWITQWYSEDKSQLGSIQFITSYVIRAAEELQKFGYIATMDRIALYGVDKRLLLVYQRNGTVNTVGEYVISSIGKDTYLSLDDFSKLVETLRATQVIPDAPLPPELKASYDGEIPDKIATMFFHEENKVGLRIIVPIYSYQNTKKTGVLVGELFSTQAIVDRYAALSATAVNFFAGEHFSIGTLPAQSALPPGTIEHLIACDQILTAQPSLPIVETLLNNQSYYQGQCALTEAQGALGAITVNLSQEREKLAIRRILNSVLIISVITIGLAVGFAVLVSRTTIRAIQSFVGIIKAAAQGDLRHTTVAHTHDEIEVLSQNLNQMFAYLQEMSRIAGGIANGDLRQNVTPRSEYDVLGQAFQQMMAYLHQMAVAAQGIAEGDLRQEVQPASDYDVLGKAFAQMKTIRHTMSQMVNGALHIQQASASLNQISAQMVHDADQTSHQVAVVSSSSEQISQNAMEVSTTTQEFAANIRETSQRATNVLQVVTSAVDIANSARTTMSSLESHSQKIGQIVKVITDITQQINLLALNATIEAARAGEVGRGFTVVASEVKTLARETAKSAEDITQKIEAIQATSREATLAIKTMAQIIIQVHEFTTAIARSVEEQTTATNQIVRSIADVADGNDAIAQTMTDVTGVAQHTSERAASVKQAAEELALLAEQLKHLLETFKI